LWGRTDPGELGKDPPASAASWRRPGANRALHLAVVVRLRHCRRTQAYAARRTTEGLSKPELMRCLKRYLAREVYHAVLADFEALHAA